MPLTQGPTEASNKASQTQTTPKISIGPPPPTSLSINVTTASYAVHLQDDQQSHCSRSDLPSPRISKETVSLIGKKTFSSSRDSSSSPRKLGTLTIVPPEESVSYYVQQAASCYRRGNGVVELYQTRLLKHQPASATTAASTPIVSSTTTTRLYTSTTLTARTPHTAKFGKFSSGDAKTPVTATRIYFHQTKTHTHATPKSATAPRHDIQELEYRTPESPTTTFETLHTGQDKQAAEIVNGAHEFSLKLTELLRNNNSEHREKDHPLAPKLGNARIAKHAPPAYHHAVATPDSDPTPCITPSRIAHFDQAPAALPFEEYMEVTTTTTTAEGPGFYIDHQECFVTSGGPAVMSPLASQLVPRPFGVFDEHSCPFMGGMPLSPTLSEQQQPVYFPSVSAVHGSMDHHQFIEAAGAAAQPHVAAQPHMVLEHEPAPAPAVEYGPPMPLAMQVQMQMSVPVAMQVPLQMQMQMPLPMPMPMPMPMQMALPTPEYSDSVVEFGVCMQRTHLVPAPAADDRIVEVAEETSDIEDDASESEDLASSSSCSSAPSSPSPPPTKRPGKPGKPKGTKAWTNTAVTPGSHLRLLTANPALLPKAQQGKKGKFFCSHCPASFRTICELATHMDRDMVTRPFHCPDADCPWHVCGFPTASEWCRHTRSQHGGETDGVECKECGKRFTRKDSLKRHGVLVHANEESRWNRKRRKMEMKRRR